MTKYRLHNPLGLSIQGDECTYCEGWRDTAEDHERCTAVCDDKSMQWHGVECTRQVGHSGPHMACGLHSQEHPMHTWENKDNENSVDK